MNRRHFTTLASGTALALVTGPLRAAVRKTSDLVVEALEWSDDAGANWHTDYVHEGSALLFQAVVRNKGTAPIAIPKLIEVEFRVDGELVETIGQVVGLAAGAELTLTGTQLWSAVDGSHQVLARVDPVNTIRSEGSEADNTLALTLEVGAAGVAFTGFTNPGDECEVTAEHRKIAAQEKGLSESPKWKTEEKARMKTRMKAIGISDAEAETLAAAAITNGQGLAAAIAMIAGTAIGAFTFGSGAALVGFGFTAVDQMLGFNLFPGGGEATTNRMVGYSTGTGGNPGMLPTPLGTLATTQFAGTTAALANDGTKYWGWSARFGDSSGNFGAAKILGTGGKILLYRQDKKRLGSQFRMYQNSMARSDSWTLALFNAGFITSGGGPTPGGGHMVPTDLGTYGSLYYAECVARGISAGAIYDEPRLGHLYRCCLKLGFRDSALRTGIHGDIHFGAMHHFSSMGIPHALKASTITGAGGNGDAGSGYNRNGLATLFGYARDIVSVLPTANPDRIIDAIGTWTKANVGFNIQAPTVAMIIRKTFEFFLRNGWDINKMTDEMVIWLTSRGRTGLSRAGIADLIFDILNGADMLHPELRRNLVHHQIKYMESGQPPFGAPARPKVTVTNEVKATLGTVPYEQNLPPTVSELIKMNGIYSQWVRGVLGSGKVLRLVNGIITVT